MMANLIIPSQKVTGIILWCMALASLQTVASRSEGGRTTLPSCHRHGYRAHAENTDVEGRKCWDTVEIMSCLGRCDSTEISDWQFPYKQSHHPVCIHGGRRWSAVRLKNCEPGVAPGTELYRYVEATDCRCQICSSEDTSCEWLPGDTNELADLFPPIQVLSEGQLEDDD